MLIFRDVTREREAERRLERSNHQLKEANTALQEFAYAASHDLQEPLRMVTSYAQLLIRNYMGKVLDDSADEFLGHMVGGAQQMRTLVEAQLEFARAGESVHTGRLHEFERPMS